MRVALVLIAKSVHGASVKSVGQIASATCAEAKAIAIGTRKRVRRTRWESRCGCWTAPSMATIVSRDRSGRRFDPRYPAQRA